MFVLLLSAVMVGFVYGVCPAGWESLGTQCFLISRDNETMPGALRVCEMLHATLARVKNAHIQHFLVKKLQEPQYSAGDAFWIDANDFEQNNHFVDYKGNPLTYLNWGPNQPDNRQNRESCVVIRRDYNFNYAWSDNLCQEYFFYICEKSAGAVSSVFG